MREVQPGTSHAEVLARLRSRALSRPEIDGIRFMFVSIGRHFEPTLIPYDTKIGQGDLIRYDGALIHAGYGADAARTFIAGRPSDDQRRIHECLMRAHEAALALMKPGVTPKEVFECGTRTVQKFLPDYMRGHIGHSVGLEQIVEEPPFISPRSTEPMVAGNTFCLELPYYAYEFGSIMVEDIVVITDYGHELLTNASYALQPIGVD
jgi:Xaa-Pro aminopeptidase